MGDTMRVALFPGSFDPFTVGHEDIVLRALEFADRVVVAIGHTATESKRRLLPVEERLALIRATFAGEARVEATDFQGLVVNFARARGARLVVRGLRNAADFDYEARMARMNRTLAPEIDTVYLAADPRHVFLSASLVREIWSLDGDVSPFVPGPVLAGLRRRGGAE